MEKTVHLLRHAEGYHNVEGEILVQLLDFKNVLLQGRWRRLRIHHLVRAVSCIWRLLCGIVIGNIFGGTVAAAGPAKPTTKLSYTPYEHLDSLTPTGWKQVAERRRRMAGHKVELVVVSPLKRYDAPPLFVLDNGLDLPLPWQHSAGVFGGGEYRHDEKLPPLLAHKVGRCPQPAISSAGSPPVLAVELCREHITNFPCDKRSRLSDCKADFPAVDFSKVYGEEDALWSASSAESQEEVSARAKAFVEWLWNRPEEEIAVVSHGGFFFTMLARFGGATVDCSRFDNCELRTFKMRKTPIDGVVFDVTNGVAQPESVTLHAPDAQLD